MCWTAECTYICPESPLSSAALEADSLLGMEPSVVVWSVVVMVVVVVVSTPVYFPGY